MISVEIWPGGWMASARPRAITLDLDGTLWDVWVVIARAETLLHRWLESYFPAISSRFDPAQLRGLRDQVLSQQPDIAHDPTLIRRACLGLAAEQVGYEDFPVDSAFQVFYDARQQVQPFDDVLPVLERLEKQYPLVALTNGNADVSRTPLGHLFDFAITAGDIGAAKPDPAMFREACRRLELMPEEIVHVGDDPEHDVLGAATVGYRTVWLNRDARPWPGGAPADAEIHALDELEALLAGWSAG